MMETKTRIEVGTKLWVVDSRDAVGPGEEPGANELRRIRKALFLQMRGACAFVALCNGGDQCLFPMDHCYYTRESALSSMRRALDAEIRQLEIRRQAVEAALDAEQHGAGV